VDRAIPSQIEIAWSHDERACALLINGYVHAVFDFEKQNGYARTGFPPAPSTGWSVDGHGWSDEALKLFEGH
jgi:hypothetical protein